MADKSKTVKIGSVLKLEKNGSKYNSIGLGVKSKNNKYANTVEILVRDGNGNVVSRQVDGFINLVDPRVKIKGLLERGLITEEEAQTRLSYIPDKVLYELELRS